MAEITKQQQTQNDSEDSFLLGAIDIGSHSIRLLIGQLLPDGQIEILENAQQTVRLGQDTFRKSRIGRLTMRAAIAILRDFKRKLDLYDVQHIWTVGTSAVREARNAEVFIDRVMMATGLEINIIDSALEGRLIVMAVRSAINSGKPALGTRTLITEVGGGSTILTMLDRGEIESSQSLGLGTIRLQEVLGTSGLPSADIAELLSNEIMSSLTTVETVMPLKQVRTCFALGADARLAASRVGYVLKNPVFTAITRKALRQFVQKIKLMSVEEAVSEFDVAYTEAETLLPALMAYLNILNATKSDELIVASVSMRDGLLLELARRCKGRKDSSFDRELVQSAYSIAEKYKVNLHHAKRVALCAVQLFDQLLPEHQLSSRHRVLLEVAALLHEIGTFVSTRAYHKHTYYLIANAQLYGLTREENLLVANVARYHRRSAPKPTHLEYMALSKENRVAVNKLASLLRLAKAMDVSDIRDIETLKYVLSADTLTIKVPEISETSLRKRSLEVRSDFFEDVFGLKLEFEQT